MNISLEHPLKWGDLTPEEQQALITSVRTNDYSHFQNLCDVSMPCTFIINFPANLVDARHPANLMLSSKVVVQPKTKEN